MKIQLTLLDAGPPFLFLGDPNKLTLSLTYQDPGPHEVDFSSLPLPDQKKVLVHLRNGCLEADKSYEELKAVYEAVFSPSAPAEPAPKKPAKGPAKKPAGAAKQAKIPDSYLEKEEKFQAHCKKLVKKSLKVLKVELEKINDVRTLQTVRNLELKKRSPRASVLNLLEIELRKLHKEIVESIENDAKTATIKAEAPRKGETFISDVIESEQEIVQLTPEMLIGQKVD